MKRVKEKHSVKAAAAKKTVTIVFYQIGVNNKVEEIGTVVFDGKHYLGKGNGELLKNVLRNYISIRGKKYTAKDGYEFMNNLPYAYSGSRFWANKKK